MKVAIVHYHLQPGGVTRVIENTLQAWESAGTAIESAVLSGRAYPGTSLTNTRVVEGLDYALPEQAIDPDILAERLERSARECLGGTPDIWHIHNHSLGKNPSLPLALNVLAQKGAFMLLHPHDFAEDGRPGNYQSLQSCYPTTYPSSERIHYAALNHRDLSFLQQMLSGLPGKAHLLANAIPLSESLSQGKNCPDLPDNLYLYPVRAVRRKNLGELALLAASHPDKYFANSLGPTNPNFEEQFKEWKDFAANQNLNLSFGLGEDCTANFPQMVGHANAIVTTSVAEGFGLGFLEPWTYGKGLCGRNLPEITSDFTTLGIDLSHLYNRCDVNLALLDEPGLLRKEIQIALEAFYSSYQIPLPPGSLEEAYQSFVKEGQVDYGRLDEKLQQQILRKILRSTDELSLVREKYPLTIPDEGDIQRNQTAVKQQFSPIEYGNRLITIYKEILEAKQQNITYADGNSLLRAFLSPKRLNLLRTT